METFIKYFIETLNRENGGALFEKLATSLVEKEVCSNILPSTGPSGGGDKGIDARTFRSYLRDSSNLFNLYQSNEATSTRKRIIFCFSIEKDWKSKLKKDIEKIFRNRLKPKEIYFLTNQFIKTSVRENYISELEKKYKIRIEILDGEWFTQNLKEKHYNILVRFYPGQFHEVLDPRIQEVYERIYSFREGGLTDEESVRVKELQQKANYRSSYSGNLEQRVVDLKTIADILSHYPTYLEDSIKTYEEALSEIKSVEDKILVTELYYSCFVALQKLRLYDHIANKLKAFQTYLLENNLFQFYRYLFTWVLYLLPHQQNVSSLDLKEFSKETYKLITLNSPTESARHIRSYYEEAIVSGKYVLTVLGERKDNKIEIWRNHIFKNKDIPLYPIEKISRIVTALAIAYEGDEEYEKFYKDTEALLLARDKKLQVAQMRKERAMHLFNAGYYDKAVRHFNIVKIYWYDSQTIRGSMLSCWLLNECYVKLGLNYAAIQELFTLLHLTTSDEKILSEHKDLFVQSLIFIYYRYLEIGLWASAFIMGKLALLAAHKYGDPDPNPETPFRNIFEKNSYLLLAVLRSKFEDYPNKLLPIISDVSPQVVQTYKMFFVETDEEFNQGWEGAEDTLKEAKEFRTKLRRGKLAQLKDENIKEPVDESKYKQLRSFKYKNVECLLDFGNSYYRKLVAEHILAFLQTILVYLKEDPEVTWIETKIRIHITEDQTISEFQLREYPNNEEVEFEIAINPTNFRYFYQPPFNSVFKLEEFLLTHLLLQCTIDKSEKLKQFVERLAKNDFFEGLSGKLPYGLTFNNFFSQEDYNKLL